MKAVAITPGTAKSIKLIDLPEPGLDSVPNGRGVLVQTLRVGVDGTDKDIYLAHYGAPPAGSDTLVTGHETFGRVISVGPAVWEFKPGDYVVPTVRRAGHSLYDQIGYSDLTTDDTYYERGINLLNGYMTERFVDSASYMVKIPPGLKEVAVLLEPLSIAEKGIKQAFEIQRRLHLWRPRKAAVLGAGPLGMLATLVLRLKGLEVDTYALTPKPTPNADYVESLGASYLSPQDAVLLERAKEKKGYDLIFEATGYAPLVFDAMQALAKDGVLILSSVTGGDRQATVPADKINLEFVLGNKVMVGTVNANRDYFELGVSTLALATVMFPGWLEKFLTDPVEGLANFQQLYDNLLNPAVIKTFLKVAE
jgi:threonine dehydrogenase-like Zn-dependent dehydrogenase